MQLHAAVRHSGLHIRGTCVYFWVQRWHMRKYAKVTKMLVIHNRVKKEKKKIDTYWNEIHQQRLGKNLSDIGLYSWVVVLRGGVHLLSGGPVEPGVVDGEASKDARIGCITYWAVLGQNTDNNSGFTTSPSICLHQWRAFVQGARGRISR